MEDLQYITYGMVIDLLKENHNDSQEWDKKATKEDISNIKRLFGG